MKKIDIRITKARITAYAVSMDETLPEVTATIGLYTDGGKEISTFALSTKSWNDTTFVLPARMVPAIREISDQLEVILIRECNKTMKTLAAPGKQEAHA